MNREWSIQPMEITDLEALVQLHAKYLNYGDGIHAHFEAVLADGDTVAFKCVHAGQMIGVDIYTKGIALSGGHPDLCERVRALAGDADVYTGDALLVVPEFRKQGVDQAMLDACRERLRKRGVTFVLYELWVHPDGRVPARHTVERYPQVLDLGLYRDFYVDFDHYGYYCPICGHQCKCSAHLYLCRVA